LWTFRRQLIDRVARDLPDDRLSGPSQAHHDLPPVAPALLPLDHAAPSQTVDQLDGGVVADLQALGQDSDVRHPAPGQALDLQQDEILLRLDASLARDDLAGAHDAAELVAQVGQRRVVDGRGGRGGAARHRRRSYITP